MCRIEHFLLVIWIQDETNQSQRAFDAGASLSSQAQCVWETKPCLDDRETIGSYFAINKAKVYITVQNVEDSKIFFNEINIFIQQGSMH